MDSSPSFDTVRQSLTSLAIPPYKRTKKSWYFALDQLDHVESIHFAPMSYGLWQHGIGAGHGQLDMFSEQEVNKKLMLERFQELRDGVAIQSSQMSKPPIDGKRR